MSRVFYMCNRHMMDYQINVFIIISNSHYWGEISNRLI
mgnify:CR=1 FL=1